MKKQPTLVIEHCEPMLSKWLMLEYNHAAKLWDGDIVFTRITDRKTALVLRKLGRVETKKAHEIFPKKNCLILDPLAKKPLTPTDCHKYNTIIVGGILGYEEPKGRTKKLISKESGFTTRHLGAIQLSIDGAAFIAKAITLGMNLNDIEIAREIEIIHDSVHSTILPFGYPLINNKLVITPGLIEYLTRN
jgi:ribosome biogenesis SPOUT family RNA methylase Rps3